MTSPSVPQSAESPQSHNGRRVAVYTRVSTRNHEDRETLLAGLRNYCTSRGLEIFGEYVDVGESVEQPRPGFERLMEDARQRRFDVLLVERLSRSASSTKHLVLTLEELRDLGVDFVSCQDNIDTTGSPSREITFAVLAAVVQMERDIAAERVKGGLRRARARGKRIGRPRVKVDLDELLRLRSKGLSHEAIARRLGISHTTVGKRLKEWKENHRDF